MTRRMVAGAVGVLLTGLAGLAGPAGLTGCSFPFTGDDGDGETSAGDVELAFAYQARAGRGLIDQTVSITNSGGAAAAPVLTYVPLDASGTELSGVRVVTAYGSDRGRVVAPALTEVVDVLRFEGARAAAVADVRVEVGEEGMLDDDWPAANDLQVTRFDLDGRRRPDAATLGAVALANPYDEAVTVRVVGLRFDRARAGRPQAFTQVDQLAGPVVVESGARVRVEVPRRLGTRFYGSVKAYLASG